MALRVCLRNRLEARIAREVAADLLAAPQHVLAPPRGLEHGGLSHVGEKKKSAWLLIMTGLKIRLNTIHS